MRAFSRARRTMLVGLAAFAVGTVATAGVLTAATAHAAAGCRVAYRVSSEWSGGFTADVQITNLGDALTAWQLVFDFTAGQKVTQAWNATVSQSGGRVQASNASYNGAVATGGTTSFGFQGSSTGSNPVPSAFTLNGATCTGDVVVTPSPSPTAVPPSPTTGPTAGPTTGPTTPPPSSGWNPPNNLVAPLNQVW